MTKHIDQLSRNEKRMQLIQSIGAASMIAVAIIVISTFLSGLIDSVSSENDDHRFLIGMCSFAAGLWIALVIKSLFRFFKSEK